MNILIKLMSIVSLVIAPTLAQIKDAKVDEAKIVHKDSFGETKENKSVAVATKTNSATTAQYK
jgi:hypothetical protein